MTAPAPEFDTFLLLIGKLNYAWSNTESTLIHIIAGLGAMDKETATIVFLTLNTARARLDLVERLSKLPRVEAADRKRLLSLTARIQKQSALRNRYNHCIYAFDSEGANPRTILMRIADRKDSLKMGHVVPMDASAADGIIAAIDELGQISRDIWRVIEDFGYPH
ncbi:hypothetical protein DC366_07510 [Pelagivirga sediminicola]|uniref:Uncharacterized protein n=1 Tax=Pelagivirga sediminicola TaxID=2170575 RepID=A0A2T7G8J1_9RHOB|nr:hypothetical protein [Pelagivirga sediminicola]PVA10717.1 hypothetical protein DC366_07510 [Pelagivirga sediminicola]